MSISPPPREEDGKTVQRASMAAEEVKSTKQGILTEAATGRKVEAMEMSTMSEETGAEAEMRGGSRWAERRRASMRSKKGSEEGEKMDGSRGARGKSRMREQGREERRRDSEADMVGRAARRETVMRRAERIAASRTKGTR